MFYSAVILIPQHLVFNGDKCNDINEPLKPPWLSLQMRRRDWKEFQLLSARCQKGLIQLCLLAVATPCLWALAGSDYASERFPPHDPPPRHLPLTQLLMSMVRLRRVTFLKEKKLKISSCKKFVRSESEYVFHAFKGDFFSTPEMLWGVRMALFVRGLWRGFPVNLLFLTKHQLVGIFWWIVGRRLLCTLHWSACILEDQLDTFREHSDSDSD